MTWTVAADTAEPIEPARGGSRLRSRFVHDPVAMSGAVFIVVLVAAAVFAPEVAPDSPYKNFAAINASPSSSHWLGTDDIGRDILSRVIYGARISLEAATIIVVLALVVALPIGLVAGYFAGPTDNLLMRLMDALFAFPPLSSPSPSWLFGAEACTTNRSPSPSRSSRIARVIRGQVLAVREETFIEASGRSGRPVADDHPSRAPERGVSAHRSDGAQLRVRAPGRGGLSFLGLGVQPPNASWGVMLQDAYQFVLSAPWATVAPGVAIALTVLSFNFVGDGLRTPGS